jgi:hypothetical protein
MFSNFPSLLYRKKLNYENSSFTFKGITYSMDMDIYVQLYYAYDEAPENSYKETDALDLINDLIK